MTALELIEKLNNEYGTNEWPDTYEVDANTFVNVCQFIFKGKPKLRIQNHESVDIWLRHGNLLFKNVELIVK